MIFKEYASKEYVKEYADSQRLGYSEVEQIDIFPKQEIPFSLDDSGNIVGYVGTLEGLSGLVPGEDYTVVLDGVSYPCKAFGDEISVALGNLHFVDSEAFPDTGESFCVIEIVGSGCMIATTDPGETHTVGISKKSETIHTIDPQYIPDLGSAESKFEKVASVTISEEVSSISVSIDKTEFSEILLTIIPSADYAAQNLWCSLVHTSGSNTVFAHFNTQTISTYGASVFARLIDNVLYSEAKVYKCYMWQTGICLSKNFEYTNNNNIKALEFYSTAGLPVGSTIEVLMR